MHNTNYQLINIRSVWFHNIISKTISIVAVMMVDP